MIAAQAVRVLILLVILGITIACLIAGRYVASIIISGVAWLTYLWGTLRPNCSWFGEVLSHMPGGEVAITIDDGPDPATTPALLAILRTAKVKATFFLIGERAAAYPRLVEAIRADGHDIGNHTQTHPQFAFWALGPWRMWREIQACQVSLQNAPAYFRSPVGHTNPFVSPVLKQLGLRRVAWSARGYDAVRRDVAGIMADLFTDLKPGSIVLIHDATPVCSEVLERLIAEINRRGLRTALLPPTAALHPGGICADHASL